MCEIRGRPIDKKYILYVLGTVSIQCEIRGRPIDKKYILYVLGTVSIQCAKIGVDL